MNKTFPAILLTFAAALALSVTTSASAQSNMGNTDVPGATIATGVVESIAQDSVTILQDSGDRATILLAGHTVGKQYLTNGSRVRIDFRNNEDGMAVAEEIEIGASAHVQVAVTPPAAAPRVEVEATVPVETYRAQPMAPAPTAAPYVAEREVIAATPTTRPYDLPATASQMPTVALLGLLALAGAVALRVAR